MPSIRPELSPFGDRYTCHDVGVTFRAREMAPIFQKWIVSTSRATTFPTYAANLKLPSNSKTTAQTALNPLKGRANEEGSKTYLFPAPRLLKPDFCLSAFMLDLQPYPAEKP
jgi:hypothetical protein